MRGHVRPGAKAVWLVLNEQVLAQFNALVPFRQRSRVIEGLVRRELLRRELEAHVPDEHMARVLALID